MTSAFDTQKTQFINLINQKFSECAATGRYLEPSIKGSLNLHLPKLNCIKSMKNVVSDFFFDPSAFDTGSACSSLFMEAIESFSIKKDDLEQEYCDVGSDHPELCIISSKSLLTNDDSDL